MKSPLLNDSYVHLSPKCIAPTQVEDCHKTATTELYFNQYPAVGKIETHRVQMLKKEEESRRLSESTVALQICL